MTERSDEDLLEAYYSGDQESFAVFFRRHVNKVTGFAVTRGIPEQEAIELAQDVFMRVHKHIDQYDATKAALPWFFSIVKNCCADWHRKRVLQKQREVLLGIPPDHPGTLLSDVKAESEISEELSESISKLTREQQSVLKMRVFDDLSFKVMSQKTQKSEGALRKLYERAVAALRDGKGGSDDKGDK